MKYVIMLASFAILSGCKPDTRQETVSESGQTYKVECIEGVEYWKQGRGSSASYMSPRINTETLTFVRCGENQ
jgi:hypothetical protein